MKIYKVFYATLLLINCLSRGDIPYNAYENDKLFTLMLNNDISVKNYLRRLEFSPEQTAQGLSIAFMLHQIHYAETVRLDSKSKKDRTFKNLENMDYNLYIQLIADITEYKKAWDSITINTVEAPNVLLYDASGKRYIGKIESANQFRAEVIKCIKGVHQQLKQMEKLGYMRVPASSLSK